MAFYKGVGKFGKTGKTGFEIYIYIYIYIWWVIKALEGTDCSLLEGVVVVVVYESLHVIED